MRSTGKALHLALSKDLDTKIWSIAWPAIIANISVPALGLVDAALLGHLDSPIHLGAVAVGGAVLTFLYWGFSFLRMGTTGEVARALGANDEARALLALGRAATTALVIALVLLLLQYPLLSLGLMLMDPEPDLLDASRNYASLRLYSAPASLLTYTAVGWFIGRQDTRWPMRIVIVTNVANMLLDALFILVLDWASTGAALATVTAEYLGLAVAIYGLRTHWPRRSDSWFWRGLRQLQPYQALLRSNLQLMLRTFTLLFAFAFFTAAGENMGPEVLAANAIMMQFLLFAAFALDGFAYAAEGLAGEALGAGNRDRFYEVSARCAFWTGATALAISAIILLGRNALFPALTGLPAVLAVMQAHGVWLVILPLIAAPSYLLDGVFIGAGATRAMMLSMVCSAVFVYLPAWYFTLGLGNNGLWLAFTMFNAARGLTLGLSFYYFSLHDRWIRRDPDQGV